MQLIPGLTPKSQTTQNRIRFLFPYVLLWNWYMYMYGSYILPLHCDLGQVFTGQVAWHVCKQTLYSGRLHTDRLFFRLLR